MFQDHFMRVLWAISENVLLFEANVSTAAINLCHQSALHKYLAPSLTPETVCWYSRLFSGLSETEWCHPKKKSNNKIIRDKNNEDEVRWALPRQLMWEQGEQCSSVLVLSPQAHFLLAVCNQFYRKTALLVWVLQQLLKCTKFAVIG